MQQYQAISNNVLISSGLNMHAVFDLNRLPAELESKLHSAHPDADLYKQLILFAHGGKKLWQVLNTTKTFSNDPVDEFSVNTVKQYFRENLQKNNYKIIYPGECQLDLQFLGSLAGWHNPSPFMVGINEDWGTWFAYRALVLADTNLTPSEKIHNESPCLSCEDKPCITKCAGKAIPDGHFDLNKCVGYRKHETSKCKDKCISRISCPVAHEHRYSKEQINYHYTVSMQAIEKYYPR